ncbi:MAG TPA: phosphoribosylglycinamide formyltransferase [Stellaceae bacterium]|jgi:phosphoribosylglycinamide formyltransferase-1|nr:phosphoribosylglycinamide formyltransferase [Stellaceae bacterium]
MARLRVAALISGRGSNLQALISSCADPGFPSEIVLVISNRAEAPGLAHAAAAGIRSAIVPHPERDAFAAETEALLRREGVELVCLAGFMRLLGRGFVERWRDRMLNIHPSLLPAFPGLHAQRQALAAGVRFAGCTVHFVRPETDTGPILGQAVVPVLAGDDEASLSARILAAEHRLYPLVLRLVAEGRVRVLDGKAAVAGAKPPEGWLLNPCGSFPQALVSTGG